MKIKRREFLEAAVAGTAGAMAAPRVARAAPADLDPTALVSLGKQCKLSVSRFGLGTGYKAWMRKSPQLDLGDKKFEELFQVCYDQGARLFDMADLYGVHAHAARALAGKPRDSYTLVSKYWWREKGLPEPERPDADVAVKRYLKELKTDYIDLVQMHCMMEPDWPKKMRKQMDILADLKRKGLIRAHGVSCHSVEALEAAAAEPWVDVVHARINPFGKRMDGPPDKVVPAIKKIHAAGKGVIAIKVIGCGTYRGDPEKVREAIRFVAGLECVDAMVIGFMSPAEVSNFNARLKKALADNARA